jgi:hypothetical protein
MQSSYSADRTTRFRGICLTIAFIFLSLLLNHRAVAQLNTTVTAFGAVSDGILRTDGIMTAGSAILTSPSGNFTASDSGKYIQVIGAGAGATSHPDATMSNGSAVLTSASGTFVSSDIGRGIVVLGAGPGGGNLVTRIQGYTSPTSVTLEKAAQASVASRPYYYGAMTLEGTIQSVQSATAVTLSAPALATISGATFAYGTDSHTAFQSAVDAAGQAGGGVVSVPAPASCPVGATCGYVLRTTDQMTASDPGSVKIRYNNVSLIGASPQTNLFCRGAFASYYNTVAFPGVSGNIRGTCLEIGDNGGPNGAAGENVSNVTIANLHLYGMTNGNTFNNSFGYRSQSPTGDGWDITHKAIHMWDNGAFWNITIDSVIIQDFKGENIFSGGSPVTGMVIKNSTMTNFNGDGISMLAADLQVLNCTISNGSNAAVENSTVGAGAAALVRQLYQGNTISQMPREGIVVVGVDNSMASGSVQIVNNYFDTIAQINRSGTASAIYISSQGASIPPANVTVTGNTCHDCYSFGVFETSGNSVVQGNTFTVDRYNANSVFPFMYGLNGLTISNNTGSRTANAQSNGLSIGAVYMVNPGYATGGFAWKNVVLKGNNWTFPGAPQYEFVTTSGLGWKLVTLDNLNWQGDTCNSCTHADANHGVVNLAQTAVIEPYGPVVYVNGNSAAVTATVDAQKQEDGAQIQIVNSGSNPVSFLSDNNMSLGSKITLAGGQAATFVYKTALGHWTSATATSASIAATGGTPQTAAVNTAFGAPLQVTINDSANNPVSGVAVTFTAPASGAGASFGGSLSATAVTGATGIASSPVLTANSQAGSYTVSATAGGIAGSAVFNLTNTVVAGGGGSGMLNGSGGSSSALVNLTAEGGGDWVHWGDAALNRKASVTPQLSSYKVLGSGAVSTYNNDPRNIGWSDGTPTQTSSNNGNGIYISGAGQGFSFTAPADTVTRTLIAHVGGWNSGGTLKAHLSDGSAPDFVDITAAVSGQYDRNYTIPYRAGSSGQSLTVSWTMSSGLSYGNVTLVAAALAGSGITATAGTPQSTTVGTAFPTALQATVRDGGGNPVSGVAVTFTAPGSGPTASFAGAASALVTTNASGVATAPPLTAGGQTGTYAVTAVAAGVTTPAGFSLTNTAVSAGGSISGSVGAASGSINLTQEGTADWVHWGDTSLNRKAGVNPQIGAYSIVGSGSVLYYQNDPRPIAWTDGSPTQSSTNNKNGIYINSAKNGFTFTVPADATTRTVTIHVGGWMSAGAFSAHLSDGSASDYTDTTAPASGQYDRNYTLTFRAGSQNQTLRITWVNAATGGNVTLNAAALQ